MKQNGCGGKNTVDVLTVYRTYLPKMINVALNLLKLLYKKSAGLFLWTQCIMPVETFPRMIYCLVGCNRH